MRTKIYFLRGENRFVVYVGKTSGTLENRLCGHFREAKKGHRCKKMQWHPQDVSGRESPNDHATDRGGRRRSECRTSLHQMASQLWN